MKAYSYNLQDSTAWDDWADHTETKDHRIQLCGPFPSRAPQAAEIGTTRAQASSSLFPSGCLATVRGFIALVPCSHFGTIDVTSEPTARRRHSRRAFQNAYMLRLAGEAGRASDSRPGLPEARLAGPVHLDKGCAPGTRVVRADRPGRAIHGRHAAEDPVAAARVRRGDPLPARPVVAGDHGELVAAGLVQG